eukprot:7273562-Pyramimonas_sp.AAC.1
MRVQLTAERKEWRLLQGEVVLRFIGFHGADPQEDVELCRLLVGNAFSGFTFSAVAMAAFAGAK